MMISYTTVAMGLQTLNGRPPQPGEIEEKYNEVVSLAEQLAQSYVQEETWGRELSEQRLAQIRTMAWERAKEEVLESEINAPIREMKQEIPRYIREKYPYIDLDEWEEIAEMDLEERERHLVWREQAEREIEEENRLIDSMTDEEMQEYYRQKELEWDKNMLRRWLAKQPETHYGDESLVEEALRLLWPKILEDPANDPRRQE